MSAFHIRLDGMSGGSWDEIELPVESLTALAADLSVLDAKLVGYHCGFPGGKVTRRALLSHADDVLKIVYRTKSNHQGDTRSGVATLMPIITRR